MQRMEIYIKLFIRMTFSPASQTPLEGLQVVIRLCESLHPNVVVRRGFPRHLLVLHHGGHQLSEAGGDLMVDGEAPVFGRHPGPGQVPGVELLRTVYEVEQTERDTGGNSSKIYHSFLGTIWGRIKIWLS